MQLTSLFLDIYMSLIFTTYVSGSNRAISRLNDPCLHRQIEYFQFRPYLTLDISFFPTVQRNLCRVINVTNFENINTCSVHIFSIYALPKILSLGTKQRADQRKPQSDKREEIIDGYHFKKFPIHSFHF